MLCQMLEADVPMVLPQDTDLPAVIHDLACQAITVCNSGGGKNLYFATVYLLLFLIISTQAITEVISCSLVFTVQPIQNIV